MVHMVTHVEENEGMLDTLLKYLVVENEGMLISLLKHKLTKNHDG